MTTNLILTLILLVLLMQTAMKLVQQPRPVSGVLPHPLLWELKRLDSMIQSLLNWSK